MQHARTGAGVLPTLPSAGGWRPNPPLHFLARIRRRNPVGRRKAAHPAGAWSRVATPARMTPVAPATPAGQGWRLMVPVVARVPRPTGRHRVLGAGRRTRPAGSARPPPPPHRRATQCRGLGRAGWASASFARGTPQSAPGPRQPTWTWTPSSGSSKPGGAGREQREQREQRATSIVLSRVPRLGSARQAGVTGLSRGAGPRRGRGAGQTARRSHREPGAAWRRRGPPGAGRTRAFGVGRLQS